MYGEDIKIVVSNAEYLKDDVMDLPDLPVDQQPTRAAFLTDFQHQNLFPSTDLDM